MNYYRIALLFMLFFVLTIPVFAQNGDGDGDGVFGNKDDCPNVAAPNTSNGCPAPSNPQNPTQPEREPDSDGDGTIDVLDNCPRDGGHARNAGCPENIATQEPQQPNDRDGDTVPDEQDACPDSAGSPASNGCDIVVLDDEGDCVASPNGAYKVNVRETPNENATIISQILPNETRLIRGMTMSNNAAQSPLIWLQLDLGFIASGVARIGGDCSDLVTNDNDEPTMTATFELEWDCTGNPRVIIISDQTPLTALRDWSRWRRYPHDPTGVSVTVPDVTIEGRVIIGTPCDDLIIGTNSTDIIDGQGGNDLIVGLNGHDALLGGIGDDQLMGNTFPAYTESFGNILIGGDGNDNLHGSQYGNETLTGGAGNDRIEGYGGNDRIQGQAGNDTIFGGPWVNGGEGNDNITGTSANDRLYGANGNDRIEGGSGDDLLDGSNGDDNLNGRSGDDNLYGGDGRDFLTSSTGSDSLYGGAGPDFLSVYQDGLDIAEGQGDADRIDVYNRHDIDTEYSDAEWLPSEEGAYFSGGDGDDIIILHQTVHYTFFVPVYGNDGNDRLQGNQTLMGGNGDDIFTITVDYGAKLAFGGAGNDTFAFHNPFNHYSRALIYGGDGNDNIHGHNGRDFLFGGAGNDIIRGGPGEDFIDGGDGNDTLYGFYAPDILRDSEGRYYVSSYNYLIGGAGSDIMDGGPLERFPLRENTCIRDGSDSVSRCVRNDERERPFWDGNFESAFSDILASMFRSTFRIDWPW